MFYFLFLLLSAICSSYRKTTRRSYRVGGGSYDPVSEYGNTSYGGFSSQYGGGSGTRTTRRVRRTVRYS